MIKRTSIAAMALLLGTAANAQSGLDGVLSQLLSQGFRQVEVEREDGRIKIEAQRGTEERTLVYNASTGALLSDTIDRDHDWDHDSDSWAPARPGVRRGNDDNPASVLGRAGLGSVFGMLRSEGYRDIEADQRRGFVKIEAHNGSVERELVYNARTGELLSDRVDSDWDRDHDWDRDDDHDWDRDDDHDWDRDDDHDWDRDDDHDWDRDDDRDWDRDDDRDGDGDRDGDRDDDRDRDGDRTGGARASSDGGGSAGSNNGRGGGRGNDDKADRGRGGDDDRGGRGRGGERGNGNNHD